MPKTFQVRVTDEWEKQLESTIQGLPTPDGSSLSRAAFVRETIEMETLLWRRSPYVCEAAHHFLLVDSSAQFLYFRREDLHLNTDLRSIPARLEMRPEKRESTDDQWLLNAFALWQGSRPMVESDPLGIHSKSVSFKGPFLDGSNVQREGCFLLPSYVQYRAKTDTDLESQYDRADFEIDIPTRHLEILMVVDLGLYDEMPEADDSRKLSFEVRNRDGVPFSSHDAVSHFLRQPNLERLEGRFPTKTGAGERNQDTIRRVRGGVRDCARTLDTFQAHARADGPTPAQISLARQALTVPERFLFYRVAWTGAHIGLTCSIKFPKPRPEKR